MIKLIRITWAENVARIEEDRSAFKILTPWRRWMDNIRMDLIEIEVSTRNWVDSVQDMNYWRALVDSALNFRVP